MTDKPIPVEEVDPEFAGLVEDVCHGRIHAHIHEDHVYELGPKLYPAQVWQDRVKREVMLMPGRNDRCPCGSGKKYKKCCIQ